MSNSSVYSSHALWKNRKISFEKLLHYESAGEGLQGGNDGRFRVVGLLLKDFSRMGERARSGWAKSLLLDKNTLDKVLINSRKIATTVRLRQFRLERRYIPLSTLSMAFARNIGNDRE
jgi:hypothetical protein